MSAPRRKPAFVASDPVARSSSPAPRSGTTAELVALEKYRMLGGEAHRVLRCLEPILATDRFEIVDTGEIARFLGIRSQAVSRALKTLVDQSIIERGERIGRSHTFRRLDGTSRPAGEDRVVRLEAGARETGRLIEHFLGRNGSGFGRCALRQHLKYGMVLYYLHNGAIAGVALIEYDLAGDRGPTVVHLTVDRGLRALGLGRKFLIQIERHFEGRRLFAHAPAGEKDLIIALLRHGFDIVGQEPADDHLVLILKKGPGV